MPKILVVSIFPLMGKTKKIATIFLSVYLVVSGTIDLFIPQVRTKAWYAVVSLAVIWLIPVVVKLFKLEISDMTYVLFITFVVVGTYTSNRHNLYKTFWWFDVVLHLSSGVMLSMIAGDIFFPISKEHRNPRCFEILFMFIFAVAAAGFWEIMEFSFDCITGQDVQRNLLREHEIISTTWQNNGIIDTMNDMINGTVGGIVGCTLSLLTHRKAQRHGKND